MRRPPHGGGRTPRRLQPDRSQQGGDAPGLRREEQGRGARGSAPAPRTRGRSPRPQTEAARERREVGPRGGRTTAPGRSRCRRTGQGRVRRGPRCPHRRDPARAAHCARRAACEPSASRVHPGALQDGDRAGGDRGRDGKHQRAGEQVVPIAPPPLLTVVRRLGALHERMVFVGGTVRGCSSPDPAPRRTNRRHRPPRFPGRASSPWRGRSARGRNEAQRRRLQTRYQSRRRRWEPRQIDGEHAPVPRHVLHTEFRRLGLR